MGSLTPAILDLVARLSRRAGDPPPAAGPDPALVARLLAMPLDVFARAGQPLELRVPWWPETLWLVPDVRHAEALWREGIARERVWTSGEVSSLLPAAPAPAQGRLLMVARREFEGEVVAVLPRAVEEARR